MDDRRDDRSEIPSDVDEGAVGAMRGAGASGSVGVAL